MQAIARVNRVYKDKAGGLIVDYIGIASALKAAMNQYTDRDKKNYGNMDISATAYIKFQEKLQVCHEQFYGFDYQEFMTTESDLKRAELIRDGVDFLVQPRREEVKKNFLKESLLMKQAFSLSKSLATAEERRKEVYFETVRSLLNKLEGKEPLRLNEINRQINELLRQAVKSDSIINLFTDANKEFNLFNEKYLQEISKMPQRNLAIEILKKLIAEQVRLYRKTNLVKAQKFSEMLNRAMNSYLNGLLTNEEVIEELMKMA